MLFYIIVFVSCLGPVSAILFSPLLSLLEKNQTYFGQSLASAQSFWLIGIGIWILFGAFSLVRETKVTKFIIYSYLLLGPAWIGYRLISEIIDVSSTAAFVVLSAAVPIIAFLLRQRPLNSVAVPGMLFAIAISIVPTLSVVQFVLQAQKNRPTSIPNLISEKPNIYHVVFDEFQSDFFSERVTSELTKTFKDFTFYREASTPYGRTEMALSSIFSGIPLNPKESPMSYNYRAFWDPERSLLSMLENAGYQTEAYLHQLYPRGHKVSPFQHTRFHKKHDVGPPPDSTKTLFSLWAFDLLPEFLADRVLSPELRQQLQEGVLLTAEAPVLSYQIFRDFIESEAIRPTTGRYVFLHLIFPHFPHVMASNCGYERGKKTTPADQHDCAIKTMAATIDAFRNSNRFKDSLIIFQSDHGYGRIVREDGKLVRASGGLFGESWSRGRSRPLLLVKEPGIDSGAAMKISDAPVSLFDIAPTIRDAVNLQGGEHFVGVPLLNGNVPVRNTRYYGFYNKDNSVVTDGEIKQYKISQEGISFDKIVNVSKERLQEVLKEVRVKRPQEVLKEVRVKRPRKTR